MNMENPRQAGEERIRMLKELLRASEELYSSVADPEEFTLVLSRREDLIHAIKKWDAETATLFSKAQMSPYVAESESLIQLIQKLELPTRESLMAEREDILNHIRSNTNQQKLAAYSQASDSATGNRLDYKK